MVSVFCRVDCNELWVLMRAAIQDFPLSSLSAIGSCFHCAAPPNSSNKLERKIIIIIIDILMSII